jgi:hypothetical protein
MVNVQKACRWLEAVLGIRERRPNSLLRPSSWLETTLSLAGKKVDMKAIVVAGIELNRVKRHWRKMERVAKKTEETPSKKRVVVKSRQNLILLRLVMP